MRAAGGAWLLVIAGCGSFGTSEPPAPLAVDAGHPDATIVTDASGSFRFCEANAGTAGVAFCSDFDDPATSAAPFGWTDVFKSDDADVTRVASDAGNAVRFELPRGSGHRYAVLRFDFTTFLAAALELELSYAMRIARSTNEYAALGALFFTDPEARFEGISVRRGSRLETLHDPVAVVTEDVTGRWHRVVVRLVRPSPVGPFERTVTIDQKLVGRGSVDLSAATFADLRIGIQNVSEETAETVVDFDDVLLRARR